MGAARPRAAPPAEALARSHAERDANLAALRELHQRHAEALLALRAAQEALADLHAARDPARGGVPSPPA